MECFLAQSSFLKERHSTIRRALSTYIDHPTKKDINVFLSHLDSSAFLCADVVLPILLADAFSEASHFSEYAPLVKRFIDMWPILCSIDALNALLTIAVKEDARANFESRRVATMKISARGDPLSVFEAQKSFRGSITANVSAVSVQNWVSLFAGHLLSCGHVSFLQLIFGRCLDLSNGYAYSPL